jgi:hypothetical protein
MRGGFIAVGPQILFWRDGDERPRTLDGLSQHFSGEDVEMEARVGSHAALCLTVTSTIAGIDEKCADLRFGRKLARPLSHTAHGMAGVRRR